MKYCALVLFCIGAAQTAALSVAEMSKSEKENDALFIKMPQAVASAKMVPPAKAQEVQSLVSAAPSSAAQESMIKAKVHKVIQFVSSAEDEYAQGTEDQKKSILTKTHSLIMLGAGSRGANFELCNVIWSWGTLLTSTMAYYYCPRVIPMSDYLPSPSLESVAMEPPSRLRSAYLTAYAWDYILWGDTSSILSFIGEDTWFFNGVWHFGGFEELRNVIPYIGFPSDTFATEPVYWHCDTWQCIAPIQAWAKHQNYCLTSFYPFSRRWNAIVVPLDLWR